MVLVSCHGNVTGIRLHPSHDAADFVARRPRNDPKVYGQLCWGNASLLSFLTTTVQKMLRAKPTATMVSLEPWVKTTVRARTPDTKGA